jgi:hypothetical protein
MSSMTSGTLAPGRARITQKTLRTDKWWIPNLLTVIGLVAWITYATARVFQQNYYWGAQNTEQPYLEYLTPFYSPCISDGCIPEAAHFGTYLPDVWFIPFAAFSLPFLGLFRFTCYYYRKAYYRSFWASPGGCAVAEPHKKYSGETRFPLLGQNSHRYWFYAAFLLSAINTYDAILAFHGKDGGIGFGLGNVILVTNVVFLWAYTLSCHSCRHIMGGRLTNFSKHPLRYKGWTFISTLNGKHMQLAWITLFTLFVTDAYIALVASGTINDLRFFN